MTRIRDLYQMLCVTLCAFALARWHAARSDERGAISVETALITFLLAGIAIAVLAIIRARAEGTANNIPPGGG